MAAFVCIAVVQLDGGNPKYIYIWAYKHNLQYVTHHQNRQSEFIRFVATHFAHNKHSRVREVCEESHNHAGTNDDIIPTHILYGKSLNVCRSLGTSVPARPATAVFIKPNDIMPMKLNSHCRSRIEIKARR